MSAEHRYPNANAARAALANPETTTQELAVIVSAYPELSAMVVAHPRVSEQLLEWIDRHARPTGANSRLRDPGSVPPARRPARRFAALWVFLAALLGAGAISAVAIGVLGGVGRDPVPQGGVPPVDASSAPAAAPPPEAGASTSAESEAPSTENTRSDDDVTYCGASGTVLAVGYTDRFEAVICDDGGPIYLGQSLASGNSIRLAAEAEGEGWAASNGVTVYNLTPSRLVVTDASGVILDEGIVSWQTW